MRTTKSERRIEVETKNNTELEQSKRKNWRRKDICKEDENDAIGSICFTSYNYINFADS